MSEEAAEDAQVVEGAEGEEKKKKSPLMMIIMIAVPVLLIGIGAALYFMGVFGGAHEKELSAEEKKKQEFANLKFVDFPDILVNLNTGTRKDKFLKLAITFEVTDEETAKMIETMQPRLIDQFQTYLRELRIEDLQGSEGVHRLREELLKRTNQQLSSKKVRDILFRDILVQ